MRYIHKKGVASTVKVKIAALSTALVMVLNGVGSFAIPLILSNTVHAASVPTVVDANNLQGWVGLAESGTGGSHGFVNGPATPPLGSGSLNLIVTGGSDGYIFARDGYAGTRLDTISALSYSSYRNSGGSALAPALQLNIDNDVTDVDTGWKGRLVYEPYLANGGTTPTGSWTNWDAKTGAGWWFSNGGLASASGCAMGTPCTFAQVLNAFPNVGINQTQGQLMFKLGSSWSTGFNGNIDNFTITTNTIDTTYDFEPLAPLPCNGSTFDTFTAGSVNGQNGWGVTNPSFDQEVVDNTYGINSFGCKSLRFSNAYTTSSFGDQLFSYSVGNEAGEASAENNGLSGGTRQNRLEATFDIASTKPNAEQTGLSLTVSPDRGDGARMSWLRMYDSPTGLGLEFADYQKSLDNFVYTTVATGLDRTAPHTIKIVMDFVDGEANDIVRIYVDNTLVHTGTSWEDYFRDFESKPTRTVDSLLFRASPAGSPVPANLSNGFLFDNVSIVTSTMLPPSTPTHVSPSDGTVRTTANQDLIDWDDASGATSYVYQASSSTATNPDGSFAAPVYTSAPLTSSEIPTPGTPEGTYYWHVKAVNEIGSSSWSNPWKIIIDNTAPSTPSIVSPINNQFFGTTPILNDWTDSSDANGINKYQIEYIYDDGHTFSGGPYRETPGNQSQRNHAPATSEQGGVKIRVRAHDNAGNVSDWSNQVHYFYDATVPSIPLNGQPHNTVLNTNNFSFTWDPSADDSPITYEFQASLSPSQSGGILNSGVWQSTSSSNPAQNPLNSPSILSVGASDGTWYWQVRAKDAAGNYSNWSQIWNVTLDTQAPSVPTAALTQNSDNAPVPEDGSTNSRHFTFTLNSSSDVTRYQLKYWNDIPSSPFKESSPWNPTNLSPTYMTTLGSYVDQFTQGEGVHHFAFSACDGAGNCSTYSQPFTVTYDTTAPNVTITAVTSNTDGTYTITGTTEDPTDNVVVTLDGNSLTPVTVNPDGTWSVTSGVVSPGSHTVEATSTDQAGNTVTPAATSNFTVPTPSSSTPSANLDDSTTAPSAFQALAATPSALTSFFQDFTAVFGDDGIASAVPTTPGTDQDDGEILGAEDNLAQNAANQEGNKNGFKLFGIDWYWILIALALLAGLWWLLAGLKRRKDDKQS